MDNLKRTLKANGCTIDDLVKVTVYLKSMDDYQEMNAAYRTYFSGEFPARECVGGLEIAFESDLEISAIAYKK
jgi:2-iminobutanoate/2-iminopropanoate deaminase